MNILYVADRDVKNGAAISMYQLVKAMINKYSDIRYTIILPKSTIMENKYRMLGCDVFIAPYGSFYHGYPFKKWKIPFKFLIKGVQYYFGRIFAKFYISKRIDWDSIDVIHVNNSTDDFGAFLSKKYNIPLVWHIREFGDFDFPSYSYRKNYIDYMNNCNVLFIPISKAVQSHWIKKGISEAKMRQVYNIVNAPSGRKKSNIDNRLNLLMIGSLTEAKGQDQIIKAIGMMPESIKKRCHLDIVGEGNKDYINLLHSLIKKLHLEDNVKFWGYQPDFYINNFMHDIGIMCSRSEGLGRVTIEYMLMGIPVIASNTGANNEIVINGKNGLLYEWGNIDKLTEAILFFMDNSSAIQFMGIQARKMAECKFSEVRIAKEIRDVYCEAMA